MGEETGDPRAAGRWVFGWWMWEFAEVWGRSFPQSRPVSLDYRSISLSYRSIFVWPLTSLDSQRG